MIPFVKTTIGEEEKKAVNKVIDSGWVVMGQKTVDFEKKFAEYVGSKYAVFLDSGTNSLFLALKYFGTGNKFYVPSFTFTATAEAVVNTGNELVFIDVDRETMCFEGYKSMSIPVHLGGRKSSTEAIIYDSAHRIEKGDIKADDMALWCYSFYATKNMSTIQGGAIATNNKNAYEWLKKARDHGLDLSTKERYEGKYKQYDVEFVGYRFKPDDLRAVVGIEQLKKLPENTRRRNCIMRKYNKAFKYNREGNHLYIILVKNQVKFINYMLDNEIQCAVNYRPLHTMTAWKNYPKGDMVNTNWLGKHCVSLPIYPSMTDDEIEKVIITVKKSKQLI